MAEWAYEKKSIRHPYLLVDATLDFEKSVCAGFEARFKQLAGAEGIAGRDTFQNDDTSVASQITRIKSANPDAVMLCSYPPGMPVALRQIRAAGIDQPVFGTEDFDGTYWHDGVPNLGEVFYATYGSIFGDDPDPTINEIVQKLTEKTGKAPDTAYAVQGYSEIQAIAEALRRTDGSSDGQELSKALEGFRDVPTLDGPTTYSSEWHINWIRPLRIIEVGETKNKYVETWTPKSVPHIVNS
jgi:branched-chain amino acid transport system substrate-binding protein